MICRKIYITSYKHLMELLTGVNSFFFIIPRFDDYALKYKIKTLIKCIAQLNERK